MTDKPADLRETQPSSFPPGRLIELSEAECQRMLSTQSVGRVGWQSTSGLVILPVTYLYDDGMIIFRTSAYGSLAELITPTRTAFEIDTLDQDQRAGSSVLVQGMSKAAPTRNWTPRWRMDDIVPWAGGTRHLFIAITVKKLSGRSILPAHTPSQPRKAE
ncbi:MAG TPA: pyridoxamine 5'-phosphate oxidase family protein [Microlunatus sp.]